MILQNQIYVMRHGESINNVLGIESCRLENQSTFGLTDDGRAQVEAANHGAPQFDIVYSSPFRRTIGTAHAIADAQNIELSIEYDLHEFKLTSELDQASYESAEIIIQDPLNDIHHTPFGDGESFDIMYERLKSVLANIDAQHENHTILLVTHGSPVEALMQIMKGKNTGFGAFEDLPKNAEIIHLNSLNLIA